VTDYGIKNVLFPFLEKNNKMRNEIIYAMQKLSRVMLCKQNYNPIMVLGFLVMIAELTGGYIRLTGCYSRITDCGM
jgi:hypothetical protein